MDPDLIPALRRRLSDRPLPGPEAQYRLAHAVRRTVIHPPADVRRAGVLILLYPKDDELSLAMIERQARHPDDRHGGQISFPGGQTEAGDLSMEHTALRETYEEIGAPVGDAVVLGRLTELYIPVSNFLVHPYVAHLAYTPTLTPQESEVRAILEPPLQAFLDAGNLKTTDMTVLGDVLLRDVPYFAVHDKVIWGATAMIMSELLTVVEEVISGQ